MKLPKLFVGIFGTLTIILSSINCLLCEDGQNVVMEVHRHCYNQLSHIIELVCGYMPDLKKKSISGKNFLFNGKIIFLLFKPLLKKIFCKLYYTTAFIFSVRSLIILS
jgi:hypothetical protein